jgi:ABC-type multidrug transport system, permease component
MILKKEFIHILRDKVSFFLILSMPIVLVLLLGFTISTEIRNAKLSICDLSRDKYSHELIEKISASGYFQIVSYPENEREIDRDFKNKNVKMALIIPANFEESLTKERLVTIQIINDVSDLNVASILNNYIRTVLYDFISEYNASARSPEFFNITIKMQYNPELNSVYMFVPGIITLIMIIVTALMSSITLSREMETGTMNMLLITPVKKIYVVIGKIIPYMLLSLICTIIILILSVLVFQMPIEGSLLLLLFLCFVFMLTSASFGLMISAMVKTQLDAMMVTMMGLFLPTVLLSGFLFPLDNMPLLFQVLADVFPAKWFIIALKDVMIKGAGIKDIWLYMVILLGMASILITISLSRIDKRRKA